LSEGRVAGSGGELPLAGENEKHGSDINRVVSAYQKAGPVLNGSWQLMGSTGLGALLGWWLDKKLGTTPWLLLAGSVIGATAGMIAFIRTALAADKKTKTEKKGR
jgi:ATP synthase protein I